VRPVRGLGEEVTLAGPQDVTVTIETAGAASDVEVLVNGERVTGVSVALGAYREAEAELRRRLAETGGSCGG